MREMLMALPLWLFRRLTDLFEIVMMGRSDLIMRFV